MGILRMGEMTAEEVHALDRDRTCVILTLSPIEEHGPHLPLATDVLEAEGVVERLCARLEEEGSDWTFLLHPSIPLGADAFPYPGTVDVRPRTVRAIVREVGCSFIRQGFRTMLLASHHGGPRHNLALDAAARALQRRGGRVLSLAGRIIVELILEGGLEEFFEEAGIPEADREALTVDVHAGAFEVSELLCMRPELVRDGWEELDPVLVEPTDLTPSAARTAGDGLGYFGAPALASAELGESYLAFVVNRALPPVRRFLEGERVAGIPFRWRVALHLLGLWGRLKDLFSRAGRG